MKKFFKIVGLLISCFVLSESVVFPLTTFDSHTSESFFYARELPWTLTAEKIEYLKEEEAYEAEGRVILQSGNRRIQADRAVLYKKEGIVKLTGNVEIRYGEDWIKSDKVTWNLERQSGYVEKGKLYFAKNHFYVEAEYIEKLGDDEYLLEHGFVTTCDPSSPDWSVHYRKVYIPPGGMAEVRNAVLQVGSVPVFFVPWLIVPVNAERQSGLLQPVFGFSGLNGFFIEVPYYWAIDRSRDATLFGEVLQKRGLMSGIEYRWNDAKWGEGILIGHYLRDLGDEDRIRAYGFSMNEKDRFWVRGRVLMSFPENIEARMNLDIISDRDFLNEFVKGSSSFEYTNSSFKSFLGTGLIVDKTRTARESNVYLFKKSEDTITSVDLHYWDENNTALKNLTLQELPSIDFSVVSSKFLDLPVYYGLHSSLSQYWRDEGDYGTKIYFAPELTLPWKANSVINTKTTLSLKSTVYNTEYGITKETEGINGRAVPVFNTEANVRLERQYDLASGSPSSLLHSISPEIGYEYAPKVEERKVPSFDEISSVFYTNRIRYGIQSFLVANTAASSEEWARFRLFQYYRIGDQRVPLFENGFPSPIGQESGFSDVYFDVEFTPHRYIDLYYSMATSPGSLSVRQHDATLSINTFTGQSLGIEYRYREDASVDEIIGSLSWNVRPWLSIGTYHNYSFAKHDMFKQGYSVTYRRNCWAITASYEREGDDRRVFFSINLVGLGQISIK